MAKNRHKSRETKKKQAAENSPNSPSSYHFGGLKKIALDTLEVYGTLCTSISADKEINSLDLIA